MKLTKQERKVRNMETIIKELETILENSKYVSDNKQTEKIIFEEDDLFEKFQNIYSSWRDNAREDSSIDEIMHVGTIIDTYTILYEQFEDIMSPHVENM